MDEQEGRREAVAVDNELAAQIEASRRRPTEPTPDGQDEDLAFEILASRCPSPT